MIQPSRSHSELYIFLNTQSNRAHQGTNWALNCLLPLAVRGSPTHPPAAAVMSTARVLKLEEGGATWGSTTEEHFWIQKLTDVCCPFVFM